MIRFATSVLLIGSLSACGSSAKEPDAPKEDSAQESGASRSSGIGVEADIGALNEGAVAKTFESSQSALMGCVQKASKSLPFIAGRVRFHVRVDQQGSAKSAHLKESTLGDRSAEECMLSVLRGKSWPQPQGGREGIAETEFTFDAPGHVRAPVDWSPSDAGKNVESAKAALGKCRRTAGAGPITATLYVETDGSVLSVGVSGADAQTEEAASCVVSALKEVKFNSPGSYAAKMTLGE